MSFKNWRATNSTVLLFLMLVVGPQAALGQNSGRLLLVTNTGQDSDSCGGTFTPCRSISQAIALASDGDSIEVGPGYYGDLSGNGTFTAPGDEHPGVMVLPFGGCVVCVTKALRIFSLNGAAVTTIEGNPTSPYSTVVGILHDGVKFGLPNHGFTITDGNKYGLVILPECLATQIAVSGNVDLQDANGFTIFGVLFPTTSCPGIAGTLLSDNAALGNQTGFNAMANNQSGLIIMKGNKALGPASTAFVRIGFVASGGNQGDEVGVFAQNIQLLNNTALHYDIGFLVNFAGVIQNNTASDNLAVGFWITPAVSLPLTVFSGNSAIGNRGPGVAVSYQPSFALPRIFLDFANFSGNNFYGNDRARPTNGVAPGPSAHCGVVNLGLGTGPIFLFLPAQLSAARNFWGSPAGPQPSGIGDNAGGPCDQNTGITISKPFLTYQQAPVNSLP